MEETLQQENQESDYKNSNEDQGGIRRRLRDRDLLKKRKAEAEEKETNQVESQRKRTRAESGTKRRGRPKKSEPTPEVCVHQEEAAVPEEAPAALVPEPAEVVPYQTAESLSPLPDVESQPPSAPDAPAPRPLLGSTQSPVFAPTLTAPAPVIPTPALFSPSAPVSYAVKLADSAPVPVPYSAPDAVPDAVPVLTQAPVPTAAPPQVETFFPESQGRKVLDQVPIKDLGPGDEEDVYSSSDQTANEDLIGTSSINMPEQNKMFSIPTLSSTPPPQKYFPGNLF
ncbi:uncharacterized protein hemgn isoform X2 [Pungitius pungitius]|uniref:uncharacterized protein hemgn isoform X2 n=1 Tax=Pungitius pungitius TaxID=134920 RepID=UPI002E0E2EE5